VLALQSIVGAAPINAPFVAIVFAIGALSFTLLAFFLRAATNGQTPTPLATPLAANEG
jgi:hypothetical protein